MMLVMGATGRKFTPVDLMGMKRSEIALNADRVDPGSRARGNGDRLTDFGPKRKFAILGE